MIISYPASPSRITVLSKALRHIIDNLKKKVKERKQVFQANATDKNGRKPFDELQRFQSKLSEFYFFILTRRGEHKGFILEKC